jgi:hypothetical protein
MHEVLFRGSLFNGSTSEVWARHDDLASAERHAKMLGSTVNGGFSWSILSSDGAVVKTGNGHSKTR